MFHNVRILFFLIMIKNLTVHKKINQITEQFTIYIQMTSVQLRQTHKMISHLALEQTENLLEYNSLYTLQRKSTKFTRIF